MTYQEWLNGCNVFVEHEFLLSLEDLDDWMWMEAFEDGLTPYEAVQDFKEEVMDVYI